MTKEPVAPIAVTMGEPAGIGGEITLKAWLARDSAALAPFFAIDGAKRLEALARDLALPVPVVPIDEPGAARDAFDRGLPVLDRPLDAAVTPGSLSAATARATIGSIAEAVDHALQGTASAVVTNPIQKAALYAAGFDHPGHTEFLATLVARGNPPPTPVMMLACPSLRVVPVTIHIPLRDVPGALTTERVSEIAAITLRALRDDYGLAEPRLAVAGLNPHAGEGGTMGREEIEVIGPAISSLRAQGWQVEDPAPADTLFHQTARSRYDAVLCMYHDQANIPLKTIDFSGGVNVTLGLPVVRTSPDHGTALDIAGKGRADPASLIAALREAAMIAGRRAARAKLPIG